MNLVVLKGNLTRDVELKQTTTGKCVAQFSLAVQKGWGETKQPLFFECVAWDRQATSIAKYFLKGSPILIQGSLDIQTWVDNKTGQNRSKTIIVVYSFEFCDTSKRVSPAKTQNMKSLPPSSHVQQKVNGYVRQEEEEDEIPF